MSKLARFYGEIAKVDEQDDGTLIVTGYASSESVDAQGEVITADAMKTALPEYMKFANIREMHQPLAAGTALKCDVLDDGRTEITAHIVDSEAVKKVQNGVYKGFSIGGKKTATDALNKSVITGLNLTEISLVDRPANPEAVITCFKADGIEQPEVDEGEQPVEPVAKVDTPATPVALTLTLPEGMTVEDFKKVWDGLGKAGHLTKLQSETATAAPAAAPAVPDILKQAAALGIVDAGTVPADPAPADPAVAKADTAPASVPATGEIKKGMYEVSTLSALLQDLVWLQQDSQWEKEWEGDNSDIPARLKTMAGEMAGILKDMVTEEVNELVANMGTEPCVICAADPCACPPVDVALAEQPTDIQKRDSGADIAKLNADLASANDTIAKLNGDLQDAQDLIKRLQAQPAEPKAHLLTITKGEDVVVNDDLRKQANLAPAGTHDEKSALEVMKMAQSQPMVRIG